MIFVAIPTAKPSAAQSIRRSKAEILFSTPRKPLSKSARVAKCGKVTSIPVSRSPSVRFCVSVTIFRTYLA